MRGIAMYNFPRLNFFFTVFLCRSYVLRIYTDELKRYNTLI